MNRVDRSWTIRNLLMALYVLERQEKFPLLSEIQDNTVINVNKV